MLWCPWRGTIGDGGRRAGDTEKFQQGLRVMEEEEGRTRVFEA